MVRPRYRRRAEGFQSADTLETTRHDKWQAPDVIASSLTQRARRYDDPGKALHGTWVPPDKTSRALKL
jgi:hypothetical protein